jgi:hypothetical protein
VSRFWPPREAAQIDYERIRERVLSGDDRLDLVSIRFQHAGLAGLIARPSSEPFWVARIVGGRRPPWSPHADPRLDALADGYQAVLAAIPALASRDLKESCR